MDKTILLTAIQAALEAGKEIMTVYTNPEANFEIEKKADNSPLTIADRKSHAVIAKALQQTPYPLLSEEGRQIPFEERKNWNELWIVDPLDGTKEFIKRNGEFTVNIAFVQNGTPEAGVIYIPVKQELFFADCAYGAYKIGSITELPADATLDSLMNQGQRLPYAAPRKDFVIVASRSHLTPETEAYINEMKQCHAQVETVSKGEDIRKIVPNHFLLVPGIGAQGGSLEEVCKYGMNSTCGLIVNSSRAIIYADKTENFATVAGQEAQKVQAQMEKIMCQ